MVWGILGILAVVGVAVAWLVSVAKRQQAAERAAERARAGERASQEEAAAERRARIVEGVTNRKLREARDASRRELLRKLASGRLLRKRGVRKNGSRPPETS